jgi:hypothetical protein
LSACARRRQGEDKAALLKAVAQALYASKICSYAQGMNIIRAKSMEKDWGIEMGSLARIWKARARAPRAGARGAAARAARAPAQEQAYVLACVLLVCCLLPA